MLSDWCAEGIAALVSILRSNHGEIMLALL